MDNVITILSFVLGGVGAIVGTITSLLTRYKVSKLKNGASLRDRMLLDMIDAERTYNSFKSKGLDASAFKKSYVLNDLQAYALSQGIKFDSIVWGDEVERMIAFSQKVNAKDTTRGDIL